MDHIRLDPLLHSRPKLVEVGWWGRQVFQFLLLISGKYDLKGLLTRRYLDPAWLLREWGLSEEDGPSWAKDPFEALALGLAALVRVGLLVEREEGALLIDGWEEFYGRKDRHGGRRPAGGTGNATGKVFDALPTHPQNPPNPPTSENLPPAFGAAGLMKLWNTHAQALGLATVYKVAGKRAVQVEARLHEYTPEQFALALDRMGKSPGLLGKNERGWKADFDWFVSPMSIARILEGKYDQWGRPAGAPGQPALRVLEDPSRLYDE